jgi:AcrR family transcriptional regulator
VREDADYRRQSLIDAAAQCLAEKGVAGTSVRAICARAGVSAGLLTHYFSGIDELIRETYRDLDRRVSDALDAAVAAADEDPRAKLGAYVTANFEPPILDPELLATWIAFWSLIRTEPAIAADHRNSYAGYRRGIERLLAECWGDAVPEDDIRMSAVAITAMIDGLWLELSLDDSAFTPGEASAMAIKWLDSVLDRSAEEAAE